MASQVPRSLLTVDTSEPLPLYTPRRYSVTDLETSSVHSSAPSYVSAAPSYHSSVPASHKRVTENTPAPNAAQCAGDRPHISSSATDSRVTPSTRQGLRPAPQYAAGYGNRVTAGSYSNYLSNPNSLRSLYSVAEWVPATEGLQSRHYQNVARRRVSEALNGNSAARSMLPSLFPNLSESDAGSSERTSSSSGSGHTSSSANVVENPSEESINRPRSNSPGATAGDALDLNENVVPLSPHEDPDLVGEEAAARFRSQRLYRVYQQLENQEQYLQTIGAVDAERPRTNSQPARPYHYSPLVPPADSSTAATSSTNAPAERLTRNTTSPSPPPNPSSSNVHLPTQTNPVERYPTHPLRQRASTTADFEEALRDQESRTWDFMIAQMADWEERQRDWQKFKADVDRRMGSKLGLSWVHWQGGKKLKKAQETQKRPKRWKSKVGLAA